MKTGIELIAKERQEQLEKHGRTVQWDVKENDLEQLRLGAMALISTHTFDGRPIKWSAEIWNKMRHKPLKDRLIIAGALIAAELDRLNATKQ